MRLHTKEALTTRNQRTIERQGNITKLNELKNIIFLTGIFQFDLVHVVVQGQLVGGIVEIELYLVTDFGNEVELNILVKQERRCAPLLHRNGVIVSLDIFEAEFQFHISGRTYVNRVASEDTFKNIAANMQFRDKSPTPAVATVIAAAVVMPIVIDALPQIVVDILIDIHIGSRSEGRVARHVLEVIGVGIGVVFNNRAHSGRVVQGERAGKRLIQGVVVGLRHQRRVGVRRHEVGGRPTVIRHWRAMIHLSRQRLYAHTPRHHDNKTIYKVFYLCRFQLTFSTIVVLMLV